MRSLGSSRWRRRWKIGNTRLTVKRMYHWRLMFRWMCWYTLQIGPWYFELFKMSWAAEESQRKKMGGRRLMTAEEARKRKAELYDLEDQAVNAHKDALEGLEEKREELQRNCPHENTTTTSSRTFRHRIRYWCPDCEADLGVVGGID